ncbi:MAG TPA: hypothetical protein VG407_10525, partial [Caulobacteraceae bacterium]|nr:hypothetical protein [Caulobacteraceae bacterium]
MPNLDVSPEYDWLSDYWSLVTAHATSPGERERLRPSFRRFVRDLLELDGPVRSKKWSEYQQFVRRVQTLDLVVRHFESELNHNWLISDFRDQLIEVATGSNNSLLSADGDKADDKREVTISARNAFRTLRWAIDCHLGRNELVAPQQGVFKTSLQQKIIRFAYIRTRFKVRRHPVPTAAHDQIMC